MKLHRGLIKEVFIVARFTFRSSPYYLLEKLLYTGDVPTWHQKNSILFHQAFYSMK